MENLWQKKEITKTKMYHCKKYILKEKPTKENTKMILLSSIVLI